jgi:hypothetical protein
MKAILSRSLPVLGAAVIALGMWNDRAEALPVNATDVGTVFTVDFNFADTLLAEFIWTLERVVNDVWSFSVEVLNKSTNLPDANRIASFAFGTTPVSTNITLTDDDGGVWRSAATGTVTGAGYQFFDLNACILSGPTCTGGGGGGVAGGQSSTVSFDLTADAGTLLFGEFASRWQSINVNGLTSTVVGGTPAPIPLPAAGWMLLAGLGGLGLVARRRRDRAAA